MVIFGQQKGFFSSAIDFVVNVLILGKHECSANKASLDRVADVYKTRFTPVSASLRSLFLPKENIFASSFTPTVVPIYQQPKSGEFETSFTPTPCPERTFSSNFYPDEFQMPYRRGNSRSCSKKEYETSPEYFNANPGDGVGPGLIDTFKNWCCGEKAPSLPGILTEADDIDCRCSPAAEAAGAGAGGWLVDWLQRTLLGSPLLRLLAGLAAAKAILYLMGVRVCFIKY